MDGELRQFFRANLPTAQWTSVETGGTAGGVPDSEYCFPGGAQGWLEHKLARGWRTKIQPAQIGWVLRRRRLGGRVSIAVRRENALHLFDGAMIEILAEEGLRGDALALGVWEGGPRRWNWAEVGELLRR